MTQLNDDQKPLPRYWVATAKTPRRTLKTSSHCNGGVYYSFGETVPASRFYSHTDQLLADHFEVVPLSDERLSTAKFSLREDTTRELLVGPAPGYAGYLEGGGGAF